MYNYLSQGIKASTHSLRKKEKVLRSGLNLLSPLWRLSLLVLHVDLVMSAIVDEAKEHADSPKRSPETVANMFLYLREICFFLSIVITSYAAIHNS